jgi:hypothetical protein
VEKDRLLVTSYGPGLSNTTQISAAVNAAWEELLSNGEKRASIARVLGVEPDQLDKEGTSIKIESARGNMFGGEVAIIVVLWFVNKVVLPPIEEPLKQEMKRRAKQVWEDYLLPLAREKLPNRDSIGKESKKDQ